MDGVDGRIFVGALYQPQCKFAIYLQQKDKYTPVDAAVIAYL